MKWMTSSYSVGNGQCVQVADSDTDRLVRDSKNPAGAVLALSVEQFAAFIGGVRDNTFNI